MTATPCCPARPALVAAVLVLCAFSSGRAQTAGTVPAGQDVVAEINRVRTDPGGYADNMERMLAQYVGNERRRPGEVTLLTVEGAAAVREAIVALRRQAALPPLDYSAAMARAAADHVRDQGPRGATGHDGSDGSTMRSRLERYGTWQVTISENIDYGSATARDVVMSLLIDDGVASRGHRRNILAPDIRTAGAACGSHREYRAMCVVDHAGGFTPAAGR